MSATVLAGCLVRTGSAYVLCATAARIDGASWFRIYWNIALPLSGPALGVVAIFAFTGTWNAFLEPLIYLQRPDTFTVPLGLNLLNGQYTFEYQQTMAQTILSLIPVLSRS